MLNIEIYIDTCEDQNASAPEEVNAGEYENKQISRNPLIQIIISWFVALVIENNEINDGR